MDHNLSHPLNTKKIEYAGGETWEFTCPHCGYKIRYTRTYQHGDQILEVMHRGDPDASHFNSNVLSVLLNGYLPDDIPAPKPIPELPTPYEEENWLTPTLREQIRHIIRRSDQRCSGEAGD